MVNPLGGLVPNLLGNWSHHLERLCEKTVISSLPLGQYPDQAGATLVVRLSDGEVADWRGGFAAEWFDQMLSVKF